MLKILNVEIEAILLQRRLSEVVVVRWKVGAKNLV
jgi:hypothetical protein